MTRPISECLTNGITVRFIKGSIPGPSPTQRLSNRIDLREGRYLRCTDAGNRPLNGYPEKGCHFINKDTFKKLPFQKFGSNHVKSGPKEVSRRYVNLQFGVVLIARADEAAVGTVRRRVLARSLLTVEAVPTLWTRAGTVDRIAGASVLALAVGLASQAVCTVRTLLLTLQTKANQ